MGRPPKAAQQRERILEEAARQISTVGYERCSLDKIADSLDLTRPAIYHYFASKQEIFDEIVVSLTRGMRDHILQCVDPAATPTEQLKAVMVGHAEYFEAHYWRFVAGSTGYGGVSRAHLVSLADIEESRARYRELLSRILRRGMRRGEFVKCDVKTTVIAIYSLLNMVRWYRPDGPQRARSYAMKFFDVIYRGLARR